MTKITRDDGQVIECHSKEECNYIFAELAIGHKKEKYIKIFEKITNGKFIIPNIYAGIFGLAWLLYRRAAHYGSIIYLLLIALAYLGVKELGFLPKDMAIFVIFGFTHFVFFLFGNFIYWYSVRSKVDEYREEYGDSSAMTYLSEKGGVTVGISLIAGVVLVQGGALLVIYGLLSADVFFSDLWKAILELANFKK